MDESPEDFRKRYITVEQARIDSDPLCYNESKRAGVPDRESCKKGNRRQPRSAKQKGGRVGGKNASSADKSRSSRMGSKVEGRRSPNAGVELPRHAIAL